MLFLTKNGVPYDTALSFTPVRRLAYVVALGELAGGKYDWRAMKWMDRK